MRTFAQLVSDFDPLNQFIPKILLLFIKITICYTVGTSEEGTRAYPPLMLFKCLLLQKWFRIKKVKKINPRLGPYALNFSPFLVFQF